MKIICFQIICILVFSVGLIHGQSKSKTRKVAPKQTKKSAVVIKKTRTISLGVMNGKAIDLKKPEYPKAASAVNAYGQVTVNVLIGETGGVIWAKAQKGHPLLRTAAETAALQSTFWPTSLSGVPVRVNGIIVYNFISRPWNWLEIGYTLGGGNSYYSIKSLRSQLPAGYANESSLLAQQAEVSTIIAIIRSKLYDEDRAKWLFEVGPILSKLKAVGGRDDAELKAIGLEISNLYLSAPPNVSPILSRQLQKLSYLIDHPDERKYDPLRGSSLYQLLLEMEEQFPFIGR